MSEAVLEAEIPNYFLVLPMVVVSRYRLDVDVWSFSEMDFSPENIVTVSGIL